MGDRARERAQQMMVRSFLSTDLSTAAGSLKADRIFSELAVLKRAGLAAKSRTGKAGLLARVAFQRRLAAFQPMERVTTLGLAAGHVLESVICCKLVVSAISVACELAMPAPREEGECEVLVRAGPAGALQRAAYRAFGALVLMCVSSDLWPVVALSLALEYAGPALREQLPGVDLSRDAVVGGVLTGCREVLRVLRALLRSAEVALLLLGWYSALVSPGR